MRYFLAFIREVSRSKADEIVTAEIRRKEGIIERRQERRIKGRKQKERQDKRIKRKKEIIFYRVL